MTNVKITNTEDKADKPSFCRTTREALTTQGLDCNGYFNASEIVYTDSESLIHECLHWAIMNIQKDTVGEEAIVTEVAIILDRLLKVEPKF